VSPLRRIARASLALLSGDAVARLLLFATTVYAARVLGPVSFGLVSFAQALLGYFLLAGDWGLSTYGVREIARQPERAPEAWRAISGTRVLIASVLLAGALIVIAMGSLDPRTRLVVALTLASAVPLAALPDWAARGVGRMKAAATIGALQPAVALVLILAFVRGPDSVGWVPLARLIGAGTVAVLGWSLLGLPLPSARPWNTAWLREHGLGRLLASGGVLMLANTAVLLYNSADQLILKAAQGNQAVGIYGGAYRIIQLPMAALYTVTASAFPLLAGASQMDPAAADRTVRRLTWMAAAAGLAIALVVWALRAPIIRLVYGEAYRDSARALGVLAFVLPLDFVISVKGMAYIARGRERATLVCVLLAAITNVVANLIWIPRYGMMAAAWTTFASYAVLLLAYALIMDSRHSEQQ
jgi:O-antigen/teichoic acid export membrane protein